MMRNQTGRRPWRTVFVAVGCLLLGGAAGSLHDVWAGPRREDLQKDLPAGVVRLSLARLHARTLAIHHNEFQARGQHEVYVYLPEVTIDGVRARAWVGQAVDEDGAARIEAELKALAEAIVSEANLAAGVKFDPAKDVRFEVTLAGHKRPWIFEGLKLKQQ